MTFCWDSQILDVQFVDEGCIEEDVTEVRDEVHDEVHQKWCQFQFGFQAHRTFYPFALRCCLCLQTWSVFDHRVAEPDHHMRTVQQQGNNIFATTTHVLVGRVDQPL